MGFILLDPVGDSFEVNETVYVEAIPGEGYVFEKWEGALTGNTNPESIVIDDDKSIIAHFFRRDYPLNIAISGEGRVVEVIESRSSASLINQEVRQDSIPDITSESQLPQIGGTKLNQKSTSNPTVKLRAEPADGWYFSQWEGDLTGDVNPEVITVDEEKNVTAVFLQEETDGFTIEINVIGEGQVNKSPDRTFFNEGDNVTLTANPDQGWSFIEWQGDLTGTANSQTVTIEADLSVSAVFEVSVDPGMIITQQPSGSIAGAVLSPSPKIQLTDGLGAPIQGVEIGVSLNKHTFTEESTVTVSTDAEGIASFDNLIAETAFADYILTFDANEPNVLNISSNPFGVVATSVAPLKSSATVPNGNAGGETVITILARDQFDNPVPGISDNFMVDVTGENSASPSVSEHSTPGEYRAGYTPETSGTDKISIQVGGVPIAGSPFESQVGTSVFEASNSTASVPDGIAGEEIVVTIFVKDQFGNSVSGVADDLLVTVTGANTASPSVSETSEPGEYTARYMPEISGRDRILIQLGGEPINGSPFRPDISPAEADAPNSTATIPDGVAGEETSIIISVKDRFGNSVENVAADLSVQVTGVNTRAPSVTETNIAGQYAASYNPVNSGTDQISISLRGEPIDGSPFESFVATAGPDPSSSNATVPDGIAGEEIEIKIVVRDQFGNEISDAAGELLVNVSGANSASPSVSSGGSTGEYLASYTPEISGRDQISVELGGVPIAGSPFASDVIASSPDPSESSLSADPDVLVVGEVSVVTIDLRDRFSNPVSGFSDSEFFISLDGEASAGAVTPASDEGQYQFEVTSTKAGDIEVSVVVDGISLDDSEEIEFEPGDPNEIIIVMQPEDTQSGRKIAGPPAVRVRDEFGNPVPGVDVTVREAGGAEFFDSDLTERTSGSGIATFDNLVLNRFFGNFRLAFSVEGVQSVTSENFQVSPFISND
jgi:hypothetical protein